MIRMSETNNLSVTEIIELIKRRLRTIVLFVGVVTGITTGISFVIPKEYKASTTILPANSAFTDKARIFNENIKDLYSNLGGGGDLDRIYGTASLDTMYGFMVDSFKLIAHYDISGKLARRKAILRLQKKTQLLKTESGELSFNVWDRNSVLSSNIANAMVDRVSRVNNEILSQSNRNILRMMREEYAEKENQYLQLDDSMRKAGPASARAALMDTKKKGLMEQLQHYQRLIDEFDFTLNTNPPSLIIIEKATPPLQADRPRKLMWLITSGLLSTLFALLAVVFLDKFRKS
jgi:capsular polysaccharide biosynthesis protein